MNINDYNKQECEKCSEYSGCLEKENIRKKIAAYLQGERPAMTFHPGAFVTAIQQGEESKKIEGFWW